MRDKQIPLFLLLITVVVLIGTQFYDEFSIRCEDQTSTKYWNYKGFNQITIKSEFHVDVKKGDFYSIKAETHENHIEDILIEKRLNNLYISETTNYEHEGVHKNPPKIEITMPSVGYIESCKNSIIHLCNSIDISNLKIFAEDYGKIFIDSTLCSEITIYSYDNSNVNIRGIASKVYIHAMDNSKINGKKLITSRADIDIFQKAFADIECKDTLSIRARDKTLTYIYGSPKIKHLDLLQNAMCNLPNGI